MRRILAALDERWVAAASRELSSNISALMEYHLDVEIKNILAWTSFFPGEADLSSFILRHIENKNFFLPRAAPDRTMSFLQIDKDWTLDDSADELGIPAPKDNVGEFFNPEHGASTLVLIPGLAFDRSGNRLGRGKGYYDRFLAQPGMENAIKVGICWDLQIIQDVPVSAHDVTMDWVVTEAGIVEIENLKVVPTGG